MFLTLPYYLLETGDGQHLYQTVREMKPKYNYYFPSFWSMDSAQRESKLPWGIVSYTLVGLVKFSRVIWIYDWPRRFLKPFHFHDL